MTKGPINGDVAVSVSSTIGGKIMGYDVNLL